MALRKQPRSIARELALLSISQVKTKQGKLAQEELDSLVLAAIRTLTIEVQDNLEAASAEIKRGEERLLNSETRASDLDSAKVMIREALEVSQAAINRVGMAIEFPEFLQLTNKEQVREYATELIITVNDYRQEIEEAIENVLVGWQLSRLPKIDRDILRISVAEMVYLQVPEKVAINESVELAKRYSDEDGFRFINGVLRRLSDRWKEGTSEPITETSEVETVAVFETAAVEEKAHLETATLKEDTDVSVSESPLAEVETAAEKVQSETATPREETNELVSESPLTEVETTAVEEKAHLETATPREGTNESVSESLLVEAETAAIFEEQPEPMTQKEEISPVAKIEEKPIANEKPRRILPIVQQSSSNND